jgi:hypothetical protein
MSTTSPTGTLLPEIAEPVLAKMAEKTVISQIEVSASPEGNASRR